MKTDIEIAQEATMKPITQIAAQLGLADEDVIPYGRYKAKINHRLIHNAKKQGKLILVTAISPTPAGEGKTTTSVGLADETSGLCVVFGRARYQRRHVGGASRIGTHSL